MVRLKFEAFRQDLCGGHVVLTPLCEPIFTEGIKNLSKYTILILYLHRFQAYFRKRLLPKEPFICKKVPLIIYSLSIIRSGIILSYYSNCLLMLFELELEKTLVFFLHYLYFSTKQLKKNLFTEIKTCK